MSRASFKVAILYGFMALPISKIRLRASGSDAGHNGLKDIQLTLGTDAYPKLRFGIGNDFKKGQQIDFVLGKWNTAEKKNRGTKNRKKCRSD